MAKKHPFPEYLYTRYEVDAPTPYFDTFKSYDEISDDHAGEQVAEYQLVRVYRFQVTKDLVG